MSCDKRRTQFICLALSHSQSLFRLGQEVCRGDLLATVECLVAIVTPCLGKQDAGRRWLFTHDNKGGELQASGEISEK